MLLINEDEKSPGILSRTRHWMAKKSDDESNDVNDSRDIRDIGFWLVGIDDALNGTAKLRRQEHASMLDSMRQQQAVEMQQQLAEMQRQEPDTLEEQASDEITAVEPKSVRAEQQPNPQSSQTEFSHDAGRSDDWLNAQTGQDPGFNPNQQQELAPRTTQVRPTSNLSQQWLDAEVGDVESASVKPNQGPHSSQNPDRVGSEREQYRSQDWIDAQTGPVPLSHNPSKTPEHSRLRTEFNPNQAWSEAQTGREPVGADNPSRTAEHSRLRTEFNPNQAWSEAQTGRKSLSHVGADNPSRTPEHSQLQTGFNPSQAWNEAQTGPVSLSHNPSKTPEHSRLRTEFNPSQAWSDAQVGAAHEPSASSPSRIERDNSQSDLWESMHVGDPNKGPGDNPYYRDVGHAYLSAGLGNYASHAGSVHEATGQGAELRDALRQLQNDQLKQISSDSSERMKKEFFTIDDKGNIQFGGGFTDGKAFGLKLAMMLGEQTSDLGVKKKLDSGKYLVDRLKRFDLDPKRLKKHKQKPQTKLAQDNSKSALGTETIVSVSGSSGARGEQAYQGVLALSDEQRMKSAYYREVLESLPNDIPLEERKQMATEISANDARRAATLHPLGMAVDAFNAGWGSKKLEKFLASSREVSPLVTEGAKQGLEATSAGINNATNVGVVNEVIQQHADPSRQLDAGQSTAFLEGISTNYLKTPGVLPKAGRQQQRNTARTEPEREPPQIPYRFDDARDTTEPPQIPYRLDYVRDTTEPTAATVPAAQGARDPKPLKREDTLKALKPTAMQGLMIEDALRRLEAAEAAQ